jgi:hypothetical protein
VLACQVLTMPYDLQDRCELYKAAFPEFPASWPWIGYERGLPVIYAVWVIGNDYRNRSKLYGAYPRGYLERVLALFPDIVAESKRDVARGGYPAILHAFSGSVRKNRLWIRMDANKARRPDIVGDVCRAHDHLRQRTMRLVLADPPYTGPDAKKYGTPMVNRGAATRGLAEVTAPGAFMAWLDTTWPMHRKSEWRTCGRIMVQRSTNHRVRALTLFERRQKEATWRRRGGEHGTRPRAA